MILYSYGSSNYYRLVNFKCQEKMYSLNELLDKVEIQDKKNQNGFIPSFNLESSRCSLSRTKRNIREICLSNDFEYFVTLTINSQNADRFSLDSVQDLLKNKLHSYKTNKSDSLRYIFITEEHKKGGFHFHGMIKGLQKNDLYINDNGFLSSKYFTKKIGWNSFSIINDYVKCCNYITKYITKKCVKNTSNQIYISSRGLNKADKFNVPLNPSSIDYTFSNDYVDLLDFSADDPKYRNLVLMLTKLDKI